jgi:hypothetical protein
MYQASYPDGTIHAIDLPPDIYNQLMAHVDVEGTIDNSVGPVFGNYIMFAGYKVKVTIYEVTDKTYKVRIV